MRFFASLLLLLVSFVAVRGQANAQHDIDVLHYDINLTITDFTAREIHGFTTLTISPMHSLFDSFELDLLALTLDSVLLDDQAAKASHKGEDIRIFLNKPLKAGDTIEVRVYYHGRPGKDDYWGGFYFAANHAYNYGVGMAAVPPTFGRVWFPCIDNFTDRATYDYHITVKENHVAACCGALDSITTQPNGQKTYHWHLSESIPTYLSTVAVSDYIVLKDSYDGLERTIPIEIYVNRQDSLNAIKSFKNLKACIRAYETRFGPYRWQKVGYVSTPFYGGAMEHATLTSLYSSSIDGTLNHETLFAHELSHSWFGNLVTCESAADMWLNEGWARYCEAIFIEAVYGKEAFKNYVRENHEKVLRTAHVYDDRYHPLYPIPQAYTYGSTVYDKGATIVHSLRGFLGDSLFFAALKQYFQDKAFQSINTEAFRDYMAAATSTNLNAFFENWIYTPGFPHFAIDSFKVTKHYDEYHTTVYLRQRLVGRHEYPRNNRLNITFMDRNWQQQTEAIVMSRKIQAVTLSLPFKPVLACLDLEEKICDATVDAYEILTKKGVYNFHSTSAAIEVENIHDSAFVRITNNYVKPDSDYQQADNMVLSSTHYWSVNGLFPRRFKAQLQLAFNGKGYLDRTLMANKGSLKLLYRPDTQSAWKPVAYKLKGSRNSGTLSTTLETGEYTLAILRE